MGAEERDLIQPTVEAFVPRIEPPPVKWWICPTLEHGAAKPASEAPKCDQCDAVTVDPRLFQNRDQVPPLPPADGWVWNNARGMTGCWERFDASSMAIVRIADLHRVGEALSKLTTPENRRRHLLEVVAEVLERFTQV